MPSDTFHGGPSWLRTTQLFVLQLVRARRFRGGFVLTALVLICVFGLWKLMLDRPLSSGSFLPGFPVSAGTSFLLPPYHDASKSVSNQSEGFSKPSEAAPVFHLLVPATKSNDKLCKTVLSSIVLNYPPPTLINFNKTFDEGNGNGGSHVGKIRGILDYISDEEQVRKDDIVLIIDGYDAWFQLPPEILIRRYRQILEEMNLQNKRRYGFISQNYSTPEEFPITKPKFEQNIIFGADKGCWPNPLGTPACADIPSSPLPANTWGPDTDLHPQAWYNRPKYLNSGTVIGKASALKFMYERAAFKVEEMGIGGFGDQGVLAEIFGEQEHVREEYRKSQRNTMTKWIEWLKAKVGPTQRDPTGAIDRDQNQTTVNANWTAEPGQNYEFGIGLDYKMSIFQAISMAWEDLHFVRFSDGASVEETKKDHPEMPHPKLHLPEDISYLPGPFALKSSVNNTMSPLSVGLDTLPSANSTWADCALATNIRVSSIPSVLHFNGFKEFLDEWWPRMWFHNYSRALLRRYIRTPPDLSTWDYRGGKGGVWTAEKTFFSWHDLCAGYEQEVFGDGKGPWGKEEGPVKVYNAFGKLIAGDEEGKEA
ncbi:MAG: hypothetical protein M1814_005274 [Vezdaea aestivalis]|nr:MAG: hypothetical protein M1814_005274 [Vezdaea aestivalis]